MAIAMEKAAGRIPRLITRIMGATAGLFYRVDRQGPALPSGPLMVAVNHPNSLVDPLLVFRSSNRYMSPLARAPLFDRLLLGTVLRIMGGIPVHRREDDPGAMHKNETMFGSAIDVLLDGGAIQIYPEGRSHSESHLVEFRTGAARIALQAEDAAEWELGLTIVPVGITYSRKEKARTSVVVRFGSPFSCTDLQHLYRHDPAMAVRILTRRIEAGIRKQTLNFVHPEDRELVEVAEQLYVRELRWVPWRARERLGTRFPRLQRFAAGLEWVRREAPEEHEALADKVQRYAAFLEFVGAGARKGDVPPRYGLMPVARYILVFGSLLLLGVPFALAGMVFWGPVTWLPAWVVRRFQPDFEATATYKLAALFFGGLLLWLLWTVLAHLVGGLPLALVAAAAVPACGYVAIQWLDLAVLVREDSALFFRLQGRPELRKRIAQMRVELVASFRRLEKRWSNEELTAVGDDGNVRAGP